jgi:AraC-like DNA-binding protein
VPVVATLAAGTEASLALRRSLPDGGAWSLVGCRTATALRRVLQSRLVDAVVFSPTRTAPPATAELRQGYPQIPWIAYAPFRPDHGPLLLACHEHQVTLVLVEGVDNAVAGELVIRASAAGIRRRALSEAMRVLRLADPLQREVWSYLLDRADHPIRTGAIARRVGCSREHLSRQFGAGGAPNLKRVIDLTRIACAAWLLGNPAYDVGTVARILRFATASHLSATARRIAGVPSRSLAGLGPRGVLAQFARGKTRSRLL